MEDIEMTSNSNLIAILVAIRENAKQHQEVNTEKLVDEILKEIRKK